MDEETREKITSLLYEVQNLSNDAFFMLSQEEQDKCEYFANLTCNIDEAVAEVEKL